MRRPLRHLFVALLAWLTRGILSRYQPTVVAVAGSVGKTMTREAIFIALQGTYFVWEAHGSLNSEIGVPLAVFGIAETPPNARGWLGAVARGVRLRFRQRPYPEVLVLEFGEDHPGDIRYLTNLVRPKVGAITAIAPAHLKEYRTLEAIREDLATLAAALPSDGFLVLNADDENVRSLSERTQATVATVGFSASAEIRATDVTLLVPRKPVDAMQSTGKTQLAVRATLEGKAVTLALEEFIAPHQVPSVLVALAVGRAFGISAEECIERFKRLRPFKGRMRLLPGLHGSQLIDDTYNASPTAVRAALDVVAKFPIVKRRLAVLGAMNELGASSAAEHRAIGRRVAEVADQFVIVATAGAGYDQPAEDYARGARDGGLDESAIVVVRDALAAGAWLRTHLRANDLALLKGSQIVRLEKAVAAALAYPERAPDLLVRQSAFWQQR